MEATKRIKQNLEWILANMESDHTENMSDGYKDGLIYALREYLNEPNPVEVIKTGEWLRGYKDGQQSIQDELSK